jgi:protein-S-isoprenylcysteine O-methyltransferase Ste14
MVAGDLLWVLICFLTGLLFTWIAVDMLWLSIPSYLRQLHDLGFTLLFVLVIWIACGLLANNARVRVEQPVTATQESGQ